MEQFVMALRTVLLALSPDTGDARGQSVGVILIVLGVSMLVIAVLILISSVRRRKK